MALFLCLGLLLQRRRRGVTVAMPVAVMGLGVVRALLIGVTVAQLIGSFRAVGAASAANKQAVLQAGIDEAMPYAKFGLGFEIRCWSPPGLPTASSGSEGPCGHGPRRRPLERAARPTQMPWRR